MSIPTSTSVVESAVIKAPLSSVWHLIKIQDFSNFWSALKSSQYVKGTNNEADVVQWTFKDGTQLEVKQEEHSTINHYITYSVITAKPELSYSSVLSTIRCYAITSGELEGSTFVEWTGNFSSDADAGMCDCPSSYAPPVIAVSIC
ncbi:Bet v1-like protein [Hypoxylon fragiforme]|uniref:Bet v1-like protein n=1 Tax=Hypoxylon fragiforme TaxID=63214 RepID=UPI0020C65A00|nr:Bet v1-like protein [Hypoxylon fragiforme]KAI2610264.1 Bet v1-like protein [Hypoxylon fragiforme]